MEYEMNYNIKADENMEVEVDVVTLEDGAEYIIVELLKGVENKYIFLVNANDSEDLNIRKVIVENGEEYLIKLDNEKELEEALALFHENYSKNSEE